MKTKQVACRLVSGIAWGRSPRQNGAVVGILCTRCVRLGTILFQDAGGASRLTGPTVEVGRGKHP